MTCNSIWLLFLMTYGNKMARLRASFWNCRKAGAKAKLSCMREEKRKYRDIVGPMATVIASPLIGRKTPCPLPIHLA
jgi:hypothetical protein